MGASTKQGFEIAHKSREIVRSLIGDKTAALSTEEKSIVERIVHSTADVEYADLTVISDEFVAKSVKSLKNEQDILTDINMVRAGINKYSGNVNCYISHPDVIKMAKEGEITRAAAAMQYAADKGFEGIVAIGNAPTALYKVIELVDSGQMDVKSVVGVGAADSKEALYNTNIPNLITRGPKGGTPVAVAAVNSLIGISKNGPE